MADQNEQDIAYSKGFLETWLKGDPKTPPQILEHLKVVSEGLIYYREQYIDAKEDLQDLQEKYNSLVAVSAQHLEFMRVQKEQLDQALMDSQREYHQNSMEREG